VVFVGRVFASCLPFVVLLFRVCSSFLHLPLLLGRWCSAALSLATCAVAAYAVLPCLCCLSCLHVFLTAPFCLRGRVLASAFRVSTCVFCVHIGSVKVRQMEVVASVGRGGLGLGEAA